MKTVDIVNYVDIFETKFNSEEIEEFLCTYNALIKALVVDSMKERNTSNTIYNFLNMWEKKFEKRKFLLKDLIASSPKEVYAILELV